MRLSRSAARSVSRARAIFVAGIEPGDGRVVEVERRGVDRLFRQRGEGRELVGAPELGPAHGVTDEPFEGRHVEVRGAGVGGLFVFDDPDARRPRARLDERLDAALADVDVELVAVDDGDLGLFGAALAGEGDEDLGEISQRSRGYRPPRLHDRPPTVIFSIRSVGQPSLTGTSWPSLLHVPV